MKISGTGNIETPSVRRKPGARPGASAGFSVDQADGSGDSRPVTGAAPVPVIGSLLSIQEVDDEGKGRSQGLNRAEEMLDLLDAVRHGLLIGSLPEGKLRRLLVLSGVKREGFIDPKLGLLLSDIELRAKVELAKLEMSRIAF